MKTKVKWQRSREGYTESACGRFSIVPEYQGCVTPQGFALIINKTGRRISGDTQRELKREADRLAIMAAVSPVPFSNTLCRDLRAKGWRYTVQAAEPSNPSGWVDTIHGGRTYDEAKLSESRIRGESSHWITGKPVATRVARIRDTEA